MSQAAVKVENISKTFGVGNAAVHAVDGVSFEAAAGDMVLIMGPSGSGKTTLLSMIGGLLSPDAGRIYYDDHEITSLSRRSLTAARAAQVGFIFQSFNLLSALNVWENVAIVLELNGVKRQRAKRLAEAELQKLGLAGRLRHRIADLSGGEKQRVAVARALVNEPGMVLADEPTANLDSASGHRVVEQLRRIAKEDRKLVIVVSHDVRLLDVADRVLWLEDGKLKEGHEELVTDPVCEMLLQQKAAPLNWKYAGQTYYFCSKKCFTTFQKEKSGIQ